jgi:hypothetical protein
MGKGYAGRNSAKRSWDPPLQKAHEWATQALIG